MKKKLFIILSIVGAFLLLIGIYFILIMTLSKTYDAKILNIENDKITIQIQETEEIFEYKKNNKVLKFRGQYLNPEEASILFNNPSAKVTYFLKKDNILKIEITDNEYTIVGFLKEDLNNSEIEQYKAKISSLNGVIEVNYKSKDEAKEEMSEYSDNLKKVLDSLDENPLKSSFIITYSKDINASDLKQELENLNIFEIIKY